MGQVTVTIGGRATLVGCADADMPRLISLAADLETRLSSLARQYGAVGEERLLLIAALIVTDELWDTRAALDAAIAQSAEDLGAPTDLAGPPSPPGPLAGVKGTHR